MPNSECPALATVRLFVPQSWLFYFMDSQTWFSLLDVNFCLKFIQNSLRENNSKCRRQIWRHRHLSKQPGPQSRARGSVWCILVFACLSLFLVEIWYAGDREYLTLDGLFVSTAIIMIYIRCYYNAFTKLNAILLFKDFFRVKWNTGSELWARSHIIQELFMIIFQRPVSEVLRRWEKCTKITYYSPR